jgi:hypothetical protein
VLGKQRTEPELTFRPDGQHLRLAVRELARRDVAQVAQVRQIAARQKLSRALHQRRQPARPRAPRQAGELSALLALGAQHAEARRLLDQLARGGRRGALRLVRLGRALA